MRVEWLPAAERNRESHLACIAERNPWAAIDMGDAIEAAVRHLVDNPHIGQPGRVKGTRELVVSATPYVIAYRVEPNAVVILRLLHGAQQWPSKLFCVTRHGHRRHFTVPVLVWSFIAYKCPSCGDSPARSNAWPLPLALHFLSQLFCDLLHFFVAGPAIHWLDRGFDDF